MEQNQLTRRNLIKRAPLFLAGMILLGDSTLRPALAAETPSAPKKPKGPPGSCGKWNDKKGDGSCDESARCRKTNCPAHKENPRRKEKAPKGTCALWNDPEETGTCSVSSREKRPCACTTCPANKGNTSKK